MRFRESQAFLDQTYRDLFAVEGGIAKLYVSFPRSESFETGHNGGLHRTVVLVKGDLPVARSEVHLMTGSLMKLPEV
jgi:hypothetical protein